MEASAARDERAEPGATLAVFHPELRCNHRGQVALACLCDGKEIPGGNREGGARFCSAQRLLSSPRLTARAPSERPGAAPPRCSPASHRGVRQRGSQSRPRRASRATPRAPPPHRSARQRGSPRGPRQASGVAGGAPSPETLAVRSRISSRCVPAQGPTRPAPCGQGGDQSAADLGPHTRRLAPRRSARQRRRRRSRSFPITELDD